MYVCLFVSVVTFAVVLFGAVPVAGLLDAAIFLGCGFGVRQLSRPASIAALVLYILERLASMQFGFGGIAAVIFTMILVGGVRAAFFAHGFQILHPEIKVANPPMDYSDSSIFSRWFELLPARLWPKVRLGFTIVLLVLVALAILGLLLGWLARFTPVPGGLGTQG